jgi:hypothetical protein
MTLSDGDDVVVFFIGISESVNSHIHLVITKVEVRLYVA